MRLVKQLVRHYSALRRLVVREWKKPFTVPARATIKAWRSGFFSESHVIYDFDRNDPCVYLSDMARMTKASDINRELSVLVDNKFLFWKHFHHTHYPVKPEVLAWRGITWDIETDKPLTPRALQQKLSDSPEWVLKPVGGGGGAGVRFFETRGGELFDLGCDAVQVNLYESLHPDRQYLLMRRIHQDGFASRVYPGSLNTLRILTMIDPDSGEAFIAAAVFRCGTSQTNGVDNWSSGGLCARLDLLSGRLSAAVTYPFSGRLEWHSAHPETGHLIEGQELPGWPIIRERILELAQAHYYLPYVGWDVIPKEGGFSVLEANSNSDVNLLQVHSPLLVDDRVRRFYEYHGVI